MFLRVVATALCAWNLVVSAYAMQDLDLEQRRLWYETYAGPQEQGQEQAHEHEQEQAAVRLTAAPPQARAWKLRARGRQGQRPIPVAVPVQVAEPIYIEQEEDPTFASSLHDMLYDSDEVDGQYTVRGQGHLPLSDGLLDYGVFHSNNDLARLAAREEIERTRDEIETPTRFLRRRAVCSALLFLGFAMKAAYNVYCSSQ